MVDGGGRARPCFRSLFSYLPTPLPVRRHTATVHTPQSTVHGHVVRPLAQFGPSQGIYFGIQHACSPFLLCVILRSSSSRIFLISNISMFLHKPSFISMGMNLHVVSTLSNAYYVLVLRTRTGNATNLNPNHHAPLRSLPLL